MLYCICPHCFYHLMDLGYPVICLMEQSIFVPLYTHRLYSIKNTDRSQLAIVHFLEQKRYLVSHEMGDEIFLRPLIKASDCYEETIPNICLRHHSHSE